MVLFKVWVTEIDRYIQLFPLTLKLVSCNVNRQYTTHFQNIENISFCVVMMQSVLYKNILKLFIVCQLFLFEVQNCAAKLDIVYVSNFRNLCQF